MAGLIWVNRSIHKRALLCSLWNNYCASESPRTCDVLVWVRKQLLVFSSFSLRAQETQVGQLAHNLRSPQSQLIRPSRAGGAHSFTTARRGESTLPWHLPGWQSRSGPCACCAPDCVAFGGPCTTSCCPGRAPRDHHWNETSQERLQQRRFLLVLGLHC